MLKINDFIMLTAYKYHPRNSPNFCFDIFDYSGDFWYCWDQKDCTVFNLSISYLINIVENHKYNSRFTQIHYYYPSIIFTSSLKTKFVDERLVL